MKYVLIAVCILSIGIAEVATASEATFAWDANTEPDLAGYKIHYGTATGVYTQSVDIRSEAAAAGRNPACATPYNPLKAECCEYTIELDAGTYFFAATAYDDEDNESDYSDELEHNFSVGKPNGTGMISPIENYEISEISQEFCWETNDDTINRWAIWLGTGTEGESREDIFRGGFAKELRCKSIGPLPLNGDPIYLIFWWRIEDVWYMGDRIRYRTRDKTAPAMPSKFRITAD